MRTGSLCHPDGRRGTVGAYFPLACTLLRALLSTPDAGLSVPTFPKPKGGMLT
jgi:hypothetical protein